jgi:hypothetical protein
MGEEKARQRMGPFRDNSSDVIFLKRLGMTWKNIVLRWILLLFDRSHDAECYRPELYST